MVSPRSQLKLHRRIGTLGDSGITSSTETPTERRWKHIKNLLFVPDQLALWFATWAKAIGHFRGWTLPGWWPGVSGCSLGFAVVPHCYRWLFWGHWCDMNAWMCNFNDVRCQVVPFKNTREVPNSIEQAKYQCRSIFDDWLSFPIPLGCCTCSRFY